MLSRPTTDHAINGVLSVLDEQVLPTITDEPARVAVQMMQQILRGAAVRAAHEIAWMHEEIAAIRDVAARAGDAAGLTEALAALDALDGESLHLEDVQARYDAAGEVLSRCRRGRLRRRRCRRRANGPVPSSCCAAPTRWRSSASSTSSDAGERVCALTPGRPTPGARTRRWRRRIGC